MSRAFRGRVFISQMRCTKCGGWGIPIPRENEGQREGGHLKVLYCFHCKEDCNFVEIKPKAEYTDATFQLEFQYHNFDEQGNRKMPYRQLVGKIKQIRNLSNNDDEKSLQRIKKLKEEIANA